MSREITKNLSTCKNKDRVIRRPDLKKPCKSSDKSPDHQTSSDQVSVSLSVIEDTHHDNQESAMPKPPHVVETNLSSLTRPFIHPLPYDVGNMMELVKVDKALGVRNSEETVTVRE